MTQGQEQDQLLQDASTLLMFASSAAARQRSPPQNGPESATATDSDRFRRASTASNLEVAGPMSGPSSSSPQQQHSGMISANFGQNLPPQRYSGLPYSGPSATALPTPQRPAQNMLPHLKPLAMAGMPQTAFDARLSAPHTYNYAQQAPPNTRSGAPVLPPTSAQLSAQTHAPNAGQMMPHLGYNYHGAEPGGSGFTGPFSRIYAANYPVRNLAQNQPPLRRQSLAQGSDLHGESSQIHQVRKTQSASPPESFSSHALPPKLVPLSPKPAQDDPRGKNLDYSMNSQELPARGNFSITHKRTSSETSSKRVSVTSPAASPGLSNVPYARGINVESGKRNTDNAMIAAAALAAAAEVPFPLKNKDASVVRKPDLHVSTETFQSTSAGGSLGPAMSTDVAGPGPGTSLNEATAVKYEDSVMTGPEEDENKTEDEPVSSAVKESFNAAELPMVMQETDTIAENKSEIVSGFDKTVVNLQPAAHMQESNTSSDTQKEPVSQYNPPPLSTYKVGPDAGTIGCICGLEEDDGFTIQCDVCFRWQHCSCMGYLTNKEVPEDEYKCYFCDEKKWNKIDAAKCRADTIARLELEKANDMPQKPAPPKRKTSSSGSDEKKRRKSEKDAKVPEKASEKRKVSSAASPASKSSASFEVHNKENPLLEDGVTAEIYQGVYYRLNENDYKTPEIRSLLSSVGQHAEKAKFRAHDTMSLGQFKSLKLSKISLPNHQKYLHERNELRRNKGVNKTTIKVKAYSENPKQKFVSVTKTGLFITESTAQAGPEGVIPAGTAIIEYLGEVDLFDSHVRNKVNQYTLWGTVKPKVAKVRVSGSDSDPVELVLDSRFVGNEARFIRRSCATTANCEIRPVFIPQLQCFKFLVVTTQPITLKGENLEEELRIPWDWDPMHPINEMIVPNKDGGFEEGKRFEDFGEEEKAYLISCVDTILNFVECACNTSNINNQCAIFKVKKATSYLLRSNRKLSSLGGGLNKSKEELVLPKKPKEYVSWKEKLIERDQRLLEKSAYAAGQLAAEREVSSENNKMEGANSKDQNEKDADQQDKVKLCTTTFRQRLLAETRGKSVSKYKVASDNSQVFDIATITEQTPKTVPIPLTTEVLAQIRSQVNEAFKPLQKIPSNVNILADIKEVKLDHPMEAPPSGLSEGAPTVADAPTKEAQVPDTKPPVVKKFSFADYKKKMK
ncbi:hypothetical protein OXX69_001785 [Metschnikowia pulcherrima]